MLTTRQAFSRGRQPRQQSSPIHEPASTTTKQLDRHLAARPQEDRGNNLPASMIRNIRGTVTAPGSTRTVIDQLTAQLSALSEAASGAVCVGSNPTGGAHRVQRKCRAELAKQSDDPVIVDASLRQQTPRSDGFHVPDASQDHSGSAPSSAAVLRSSLCCGSCRCKASFMRLIQTSSRPGMHLA